jgi:hypothetical protein
MSSGTTHVCSLIVCTNLSATSGNDTQFHGIESLSGMGGGEFYSVRLCTMPLKKSSIFKRNGAPFIAATFNSLTAKSVPAETKKSR